VALKILLADDSMTAQNMGKKILVEAGYEVIAVSNGAAAVKKIAEHKPDMVVADVYMPGYSGLEVCERVKNAADTAKTPVILTVGKMEPFKAEDGQRVRSDGLIVKPFESSDLLAAVRKIEQKIAQMAPPPPATVKITAPEEFKDESYEEWKVTAEPHEAPAKFEVPSDMASAPAFDMEMMGEPAPPAQETPSFEASSVAHVEVEAPPSEPLLPEAITPEPALDLDTAVPPAPLPELREMTVAEELKLVETKRDPALEPTILEAGTAPEAPQLDRDPGLVTDAAEMQQFITKFGVEGEVEPIAVGLASEMPELYADSAPAEVLSAELAPGETPSALEETQDVAAAAAEVMGRTGDTQDLSESAAKVEAMSPEADFEARVAAAMNSFDMPAETVSATEPVPEAVLEAVPEPVAAAPGMDTQAIQEFAAAVAEIPAEAAPPEPEPVAIFPPEPVAEIEAPSLPEAAPQVASIEQEMARAFAQAEAAAEQAAVPQVAAMAAVVGGSVQQASAEAGISGLDDETLGHIVHTVVERLKPELFAEIRRKLAEKK
jgi:CheY-like chemotaxis protein